MRIEDEPAGLNLVKEADQQSSKSHLLFVNISFFPARKRTALHLAVGTKNIKMVRALMQWRRELNNSLQDELDSLNHRRDMFIQGHLSASSGTGGSCPPQGKMIDNYNAPVGRFEKWLSEERRRLVRVTELRCEECWRKAMLARDDKGRTPLHWAASGTVLKKHETPEKHSECSQYSYGSGLYYRRILSGPPTKYFGGYDTTQRSSLTSLRLFVMGS